MKYLSAKLTRLFILASIGTFVFPSVLFAQANMPPPGGGGTLTNPITQNDIVSFIVAILQGFIKLGIPVVALAVIYCGFLFVSARGNSEKISKAKDALFWTLIGAAILLGSMALATLIRDTIVTLSP